MRILFLTTSFPSAEQPYNGIFVGRLAQAVNRHAEVRVMVPRGGLAERGEWQGLTVSRVRYAPRSVESMLQRGGGIPAALSRNMLNYLYIPSLLWRLRRNCCNAVIDVDVIHANWAVCGWLASGCGRPVLTTLRGADVERAERSRVDRWILGRALSGSRRCITVNEDLKARAADLFPHHAAKLTVVPNGVGKEFLAIPEPRPTAELRMVAIGSLIRRKGFDVLIGALGQMSNKAWTLDIFGEGTERDELATMIRRAGLGRKVFLRGSIPPDQVPCVLQSADVLVCPSRSEGRPNVVLEAMAAARCVVAADIPGMREIVENRHNGLLFPGEDKSALASSLEQLMENPAEAVRMGMAARAYISGSGLTWESAAEKCVREYCEVIK